MAANQPTTALQRFNSQKIPGVHAPSNLDRVVTLPTSEDVGIIRELCENPPLRSVVMKFSPAAAERVLEICNNKNRKLTRKNAARIEDSLKDETFELTGDTIKFGKNSGDLLDGQHRLEAAVKANRELETHVVFGVDDDIFDVLDQGRKRTPADVLGIAGLPAPTQFAAAIRWAKALDQDTSPKDMPLSNRQLVKLAKGRYKDLQDWLSQGQVINKAYKHAPAMIAAMLFVIARHDKKLAEDFVHDWQHGARNQGVNKNFDILSKAILHMTHEGGGRLNNYVRAAMVINMFNMWHAGVEATGQTLTWKVGWRFPRLQFDKSAFKKEIEVRSRFSELTAGQKTVYIAIESGLKPGSKRVNMSIQDVASLSDMRPGGVAAIVKQLVDRNYLRIVEEGESTSHASIFQIEKALGLAELNS